MSKELIKQRILKEKPDWKKEMEEAEPNLLNKDVPDTRVAEDPNTFLLNNLLLTVQFFENYEREVEILRERWFEEVSLESHRKKCFFADSLFRESGAKVKFSSPQGMSQNAKHFLHPLRMYIISDNVDAAFDPALLGRVKKNAWPQYQFIVKMDERDEKSGSASLILFKTFNSPKNRLDSTTLVNDRFNFEKVQGKSGSDERSKKRATTEKFFTFNNKELNSKMQEDKISLKCFNATSEGTMAPNCFYFFETPEENLDPVPIAKYRMNESPASDDEIPRLCFQREVIQTNLGNQRRMPAGKFSRTRKVLNSAAFKGHFCDLLIESLAEALGFDAGDVQEGLVHEEFAVFGKEMKIHITQAIEIFDWKRFIPVTEHRHHGKSATEMAWPTNQMWEIVNILPCYAVPYGLSDLSRKSLDHEKKWKIVFPKTEQFLLLHMMHSQIRCFFFVLSIYKSFIEPEINTASLGPRHLLHLLFWQVHKHFLAWPDERPAENLLNYFKVLYKKLQNKFLRDFFINSRNLFATSPAKDIHRAQALIKIFLQNPIPYVLRAIRNLQFDSNFYPAFDVVRVNLILSPNSNIKNPNKRFKKEKFEKKVYFEDVEKRLWRKSMRQMQSEQRVAGQLENRKDSILLTDIETIVNFDFRDFEKFSQILKILILHYVDMGSKSVEFKFLTQAFIYLFQIQSVFELVNAETLNTEDLKALREKINELKEKCEKLKQGELNQRMPLHRNKKSGVPQANQRQTISAKQDSLERQKIFEKNQANFKVLKKVNLSDHPEDQTQEWETKL